MNCRDEDMYESKNLSDYLNTKLRMIKYLQNYLVNLYKTQIKEAIRQPADVGKTVPEKRIASKNSIPRNDGNATKHSLSVDSKEKKMPRLMAPRTSG